MSDWLQRQPRVHGLLAERPLLERNGLDRWVRASWLGAKRLLTGVLSRDRRLVARIGRRADQLASESPETLTLELQRSRAGLRLRGLDDAAIVNAFALVMVTSQRVLGMRHHPTQILAGLALLKGRVAEMATGEGKSLAATLAAATAALAGVPVHIVTVNDYLAERDAAEMGPLYRALGLSCAAIVHDLDDGQRRAVYASDVVYCSNKELVFDYLKDELLLDGRQDASQRQLHTLLTGDTQLRLRGLHYAIVDEADSVFIDEARTPLIISGRESMEPAEASLLREALGVAQTLRRGFDFELDERRGLRLTPAGEARLAELTRPLGGLWLNAEYREGLAVQALTALHRFHRDRDYLIDDEGQVQIIDPHTGRIMPGRSWSQGLHQLVELKEGVPMSKPRETRAEISYQNFFRKYCALAGMTGTALEVRREFADIYGLQCEVIPLLRASRRRTICCQVLPDQASRTERVASYVRELNRAGQPVLVGTGTVATSEEISAALHRAAVPHRVLNARQDREEAEIVATAGQAGAVTIATSMAGRGTDIKLNTGATAAGGLCVLITELQSASRVDRQLAGRAARQGDPGSIGWILALDDLVVHRVGGRLRAALGRVARICGHRVRFLWLRHCQQTIERLHYKQRMALVKSDTRRRRMLSFSHGRRLQGG